MINILANQEIHYDRDIMFRPQTENVEETQLKSPERLYSVFDEKEILNINREDPTAIDKSTYYDKVVQDFFKEKWIKKLTDIQSNNDPYLIDEEINHPNEIAINYAYQIITELSSINIFPDKLSTSADEGICMKFRNKGKNLYFEVYNTGELGYIIEDTLNQIIIENEDLFSIREITEKINDFIMI